MKKKRDIRRFIFWLNVLCVALVLFVNFVVRSITVLVIDTSEGIRSVEVVKKYIEYFPELTHFSIMVLLSVLVVTVLLERAEQFKLEKRATEFASYFKDGRLCTIDLTKAKNKNEELILASWNKSINEINTLNEKREYYFKGMVHDFKMPIQILKSNNDLLKFKFGNNRYFESIDDMIVKLNEDTSQILYLDKIKYFEKPDIVEVDIYRMLKKMVTLYGLESEMTIINHKQPYVVKTDKTMISKIFQNIIDNGIKHKSGGKLEVEFYQDYLIFTNETDNKVNMENIYNGSGVKSTSGFGMGNLIVYEYAQLIGITVDSKVEKSRFIVTVNF